MLSKNIFRVHRRVHGPRNRMKMEDRQSHDFRRENVPGTKRELGAMNTADF